MTIFGTIGLVRRYIPYPSGMIAMLRGILGALFLTAVHFIGGNKFSWRSIKKNLPLLCLSGACLGLNWILLFEAYRFTTVSIATVCYYMAPVTVILTSPIFFGERLTAKKIACVVTAVAGMAISSEIFTADFSGITGILFGLGASVMYSALVIANKKMSQINADERTVFQLATAAVMLLPYVLAAEGVSGLPINGFIVVMLLIVGIVHTGIAYALYFGSIHRVSAQTAAFFGYIDPIVAIATSALILREDISLYTVVGAAMVIGAMLTAEKIN